MGALRLLVALTMVWAVAALATQVVIARGGGRRDYSRRAARPWWGVLHNFTIAMLPGHKESARFHPREFAAGIVLHIGVFAALAEVLVLLCTGTAGPWFVVLRLLAASGAIAGLGLFIRRARSPLLRKLSTPDDYVAVLATAGLLGLAAFPAFASGSLLLADAALVFLYLPLGKLRHAAFFFVARGNYGWRLGYRGVYPPARVPAE